MSRRLRLRMVIDVMAEDKPTLTEIALADEPAASAEITVGVESIYPRTVADAVRDAPPSPDPPVHGREVLPYGYVRYTAWSEMVNAFGGTSNVVIGVSGVVPDTGFPGVPDTQIQWFGLEKIFKPEKFIIPEGHGRDEFSIPRIFGGQMNLLPQVAKPVPGTAFRVDGPQPKYTAVPAMVTIIVNIINDSQNLARCCVQVVGREIEMKKRQETTALPIQGPYQGEDEV